MIIDAHSHLGRHNNRHWSAEDLVASMDVAGIDYSLVITDRHSQYSATRSVIQLSEKYPQIKVIGDISFSSLSKNEKEYIFGYLKDGKIVGLKFYLGYEDYYPNDAKLHPIYSFCEKNGYPVVFHTGLLEVGYQGLLKQAHPLNIDEVAHMFPKLRIVIAHMGNPWLMDCAAVVIKNENVYTDISGFFAEYESVAKDEVELFVKQLGEMRTFMGSFEKVIFGTDFPLYDQKEYLNVARKLPLTKQEAELVFWRNAKEIYNLAL